MGVSNLFTFACQIKTMMKKFIFIAFYCLSAIFATANDGVFYASGNQLIPITETDISVKKEVLTLNRVGDHIEVTVYYEFFNPVGEKELLVGFEAKSPYNSSLDPFKVFPRHPHIRNFKVAMNGEPLTYDIANVEDGRYVNEKYQFSQYYSNGRFINWTPQQIEDTLAAWGDPPGLPIDYVYHFKAKFRPGLNIIYHTYDFDLSFSIGEEYYFPYVLTAANRWANHQIDDFLLLVNMGDRESFSIDPDFFQSPDEWRFLGKGKATAYGSPYPTERDVPVFHVQEGSLSFRKANFHPEGELYLRKSNTINYTFGDPDDAPSFTETLAKQYYFYSDLLAALRHEITNSLIIPSDTDYEYNYDTLVTPEQRRILKNLPFAYRGYIFKDKALRDYFESTDWYLPNPEYDGNMDVFSAEERKWVEFWK